MFCRNCGKEIDDNAWVCMGCGVKVGQRDRDGKVITHYCNRCGTAVNEYQSICTQCGNVVDEKLNRTNDYHTDDYIIDVKNITKFNRNTEQAQTHRSEINNTLYDCYKDAWRIRVNEVATRKQYWGAWLYNFLYAITLFITVFLILSIAQSLESPTLALICMAVLGLAYLIYGAISLVLFIPLTIRRLHDAGFSGWMMLLSLIPLVGGIVGLVLLCLPSKLENNPYR